MEKIPRANTFYCKKGCALHASRKAPSVSKMALSVSKKDEELEKELTAIIKNQFFHYWWIHRHNTCGQLYRPHTHLELLSLYFPVFILHLPAHTLNLSF